MSDNLDIIKGLESIDKKLGELEKDRKTSQSAINSELKRLGEEQTKLAKALSEFEQKNLSAPQDTNANLSLGEIFVKSDSYQNFSNTHQAFFEFDKAASTTAAANSATRTSVSAPYMLPGILTLPDSPLKIEALFQHVPISENSVQYVKEGAMTNNAAVVAEAGNKPETTFTAPTIKTADIVTVAHWTRITKQLSADSVALTAYINQKLQYGLSATIETQLINGEGGSTELPGMLYTGNYTDPSKEIQPSLPTGADLFDYALFLKSKMESSNILPEYFIFNPSDWTALAALKDKQGRYLLGGPQTVATKSLWGVPVITSASVTAGKFLLANFSLAGTIYDRETMSLAMSESDSTNFTQNLITLRVERRLGFAIEQTAAIYGGAWAVPTAAA